jgi:hypothetical protein
MLKKYSSSSEDTGLGTRFANVTNEYIEKQSSRNISGDNEVDIDSRVSYKMLPSVASIVKEAKIEKLFNNNSGIKATNTRIAEDLEGKDLENDWLLMRARAIDACGFERKAGSIPPEGNNADLSGPNANHDYFSEEELLKINKTKNVRAFETFVGCPFFTNHKNDDVEQARGLIVNAYYDLDDHCVYTDVLVDAKAYPELARGIREGIMKSVSMGTQVGYSICSHCGKKASSPTEYCNHIANQKGRLVEGKKVYEINCDLGFIELSQVVDGACKDCKVVNKNLDPTEILERVAEARKNIKKTSSIKNTDATSKMFNQFIKDSSLFIKEVDRFANTIKFKNSVGFRYASKEDLTSLYKALTQLKDITIKIIQSEEVDYGFVKDLAEILEKLQLLIVDLAEAGFGELSTDNTQGAGDQQGTGAAPGAGAGNVQDMNPAAQAQPQSFSGESEIQNPLKELGLEQAAKNSLISFYNNLNKLSNKIENHFDKIVKAAKTSVLNKIFKNFTTAKNQTDLSKIKSQISQNWDNLKNKEHGPMEIKVEAKDGNYKIVIAGNTVMGENSNGEKFTANLDELPKAIFAEYEKNPSKAANLILKSWKDGEINKIAYSTNPPPQDEIQEGQLENYDGNFKRTRPVHEENLQVFEGQLDNIDISSYTGEIEYKDGNGNVNSTGYKDFGRKDWGNEPTTESRLEDRRTNDVHLSERNVQEDQLSKLSTPEFGRWNQDTAKGDVPVTEGQLKGESSYQEAEKDRAGYAINEVQEGQLNSRRQGKEKEISSIAERSVNELVKSAAKTVIEREINPKQVVKAFDFISKLRDPFSSYVKDLSDKKISQKAKNAIVGRLGISKASSSVTSEQITAMLLDRISVNNFDNLNYLSDISPYVKKAASFLYQNQEETIKAIAAEIEKEVSKIKDTVSGKNTVALKEDLEKEAFTSALKKKAGTEEKVQDTNSYTVEFSEEDKNGDLKEAIAEALMESGIKATSSNIELSNIRKIASDENEARYKTDVKVISQPTEEEIKLAEVKNLLRKVAQTPPVGTQFGDPSAAGENAPPQEGMQGGGVGALTTPPSDEMQQDDELFDDTQGSESVDGEPKFPGDHCMLCASSEMEKVGELLVCKNCGAEHTLKVSLEVLNIGKVLNEGPESEEAPAEDTGMDAMTQDPASMQQQAPQQSPQPPASFPAQASIIVHPSAMLRTANYFGRLPIKGIASAPGTRCPNCLSSKVHFEKCKGTCIACGTDYTVRVSKARNNKVNATIDWISTNAAKDLTKADCKECQATVKKFFTKLAQVGANHKSLGSPFNSRIKKIAGKVADAGMFLCKEDRMKDGFSREASCDICEIMEASYLEEAELNKLAQFSDLNEEEGTMEDNNVGDKLKNPMNEFKDELLEDDSDSDIELEDDSDFEMEDDSEELFDDSSEDLEDDSDDSFAEENGYLNNLPEDEEGGVSGDNINVNINIETPDFNKEVQFEIDPTTGDVMLIEEAEDEEFDFDVDGEEDLLDDSDSEEGFEESEDSDEESENPFESDDSDEEESDFGSEDFEGDSEEDEGDSEESDDSDEEDLFKESDEDEENQDVSSLAMSSSRILPNSRTAGKNIDIKMLAKKMNLDKKTISQVAKKTTETHPLLRKAANVKLASGPNMLGGVKLAQVDQTMPLSVEDDVDAGVPRDESVGLKQTEPKKVREVFEKGYEKGKGNNTKNEAVPRDKSGDGAGGKKVEFAKELSDKATSGNPDKYVQELQENGKATPAENKDNHAIAKQELKKLIVSQNLDPKKVEFADIGTHYLVAHDTRLFKLAKINPEKLNEDLVAKFEKISVKVSSKDGNITKFANKEKEENCEGKEVKKNEKNQEEKDPKKKKQNFFDKINEKEAKALNLVVKKTGSKISDLTLKEDSNFYTVANKKTNKTYKIKK